MWTLGCLIFNMVTGVPAFFNENKQTDSEVFEKIRASDWRPKLNEYRENPTENRILFRPEQVRRVGGGIYR